MVTLMPIAHTRKFSALHVLEILFKHKRMIASVLVISGLVAALVSLATPRKYEADATLLINTGREYVYRSEFSESTYPVSRYRLVEVVNSEIQILNSRDLKEQVINTIGMKNLYPAFLDKKKPLELALDTLGKNLSIKSIVDSSIIKLAFTHEDPIIAAKVLSVLIKDYNEKHVHVYGNSALPFLEEQVRSTKKQLDDAEKELEDFRQGSGVYDIEKQTDLLLTQRSDLERALNGVENEIKENEQKNAAMQAQMSTMPKNVPMYTETKTDDVSDESKTRLLELQVEEQKLLSKYTESSRPVRDIRQEIQSVKNLIAAQSKSNSGMIRTGKNPVLEALELESARTKATLQALFAKRDVLTQQIDTLNAQLKEIDSKQDRIRELKRNVSNYSKNYNTYLSKLEEAKSQSELDRMKETSIRVVQPADVPMKPLGLSRKVRVLLGMFLGLMAGIGMAIFSEVRQRYLANAYAIEQRLQLPILTVLPDRESSS